MHALLRSWIAFSAKEPSSVKKVIASLVKHKPRYTYSLFDLTRKYSHFWEGKRHKLWRMKWMWKTLSNEAKEKLFFETAGNVKLFFYLRAINLSLSLMFTLLPWDSVCMRLFSLHPSARWHTDIKIIGRTLFIMWNPSRFHTK